MTAGDFDRQLKPATIPKRLDPAGGDLAGNRRKDSSVSNTKLLIMPSKCSKCENAA